MDTQDSAYVLHQRNLSDSRIIVELFTQHHGRIAAVWRRSKGKARYLAVQPFSLFECTFYGASELKKLKQLEHGSAVFRLSGESLYCGFYLNEILTRALAKEEAYPDIFELYTSALSGLLALSGLSALQQKHHMKSILRTFEIGALRLLGYGIDFSSDTSGKAIVDSKHDYYHFESGEGFIPSSSEIEGAFSGEVLREIGRENWRNTDVENAAKYICREALRQVIGDKPLKSRELFKKLTPAP